ncbi:DUF6338 family protein [Halorussus caseinilyticus]|uniref:DUF6338 family protein n=1 Tax=Halorussus caseinilyticus TaxID=3034025 RepID=UPI0023E78B10|nr:DUF6338 family protein [Halorussus sp. DT72]
MAIGIFPKTGLLSIILFLLPGLAGVKLGLQIADRSDWLNRIDTVALSFGVSLFSMIIIYFVFSLPVFFFSPRFSLSTTQVQTRLSTISSTIFYYSVLMAFALAVGGVLGRCDFGRNLFTSSSLWHRFFDIAENSGEGESYAVRIRTNAGDELYGRVEDEGETAISRDIILESPPKGLRRIRYDENGEVAEEYHLTGYAYVHNQSISHIEFDRLENADEAEAREAEMDDQRTLSDNYAKVSGEEIAELKEFADDDTDGKQTESD